MNPRDLINFIKGFFIGCFFLFILGGFLVLIMTLDLEFKALLLLIIVGSYSGYMYYDTHKDEVEDMLEDLPAELCEPETIKEHSPKRLKTEDLEAKNVEKPQKDEEKGEKEGI
jgi:hypothetical protein